MSALAQVQVKPTPAEIVLEVLPMVMQSLRASARAEQKSSVTLPQLQMLSFINRHPGCRLGAASAYLGIGMPTASSTVARLAKQGLLTIVIPPENRRSAAISLTDKGQEVVLLARARARDNIQDRLLNLSSTEQHAVGDAMQLLKRIFSQ